MKELNQWMAAQGRREAKIIGIEDALLTGRFWPYALYRLRFFFLRFGVGWTVHVLEFAFLSYILPKGLLMAAVVLRTASLFIDGWWWGALEKMREQIRQRRKEGTSYRTPAELSLWLSAAAALAGLSLLLSLGWYLSNAIGMPDQQSALFQLYSFGVLLRTSLGFFTRAFHSGVYAVKRVYRPALAIVAVDLVGLLSVLLLWPLCGIWGFPLAYITSVLVMNGLTLFYVWRMYRFVGFFPLTPRFDRGLLSFIRRQMLCREFLLGGLAANVMRLESLLVLAVLAGTHWGDISQQVLLLIYLISPQIAASHQWAMLFYFDFKKLEIDFVENLKTQFDRQVLKVSWVIGLVTWGLAAATAALYAGPQSWLACLCLLPLFVARSLLAFVQVRSFAERRYLDLLISGLVLLIGVWSIQAAPLALEKVALLSGLLLLSFFYLSWRKLGIHGHPSRAQVLPFTTWLQTLGATTGSVQVKVAHLCAEASAYETGHLAKVLGQQLRSRGQVCVLAPNEILWFELRQGGSPLAKTWLTARGAGLVESVRSTGWQQGGILARARAAAQNMLGAEAYKVSRRDNAPLGRQTLERLFETTFPEGYLVDLTDPNRADLKQLKPQDRRQALRQGVQFSKTLKVENNRAPYETSALSGEHGLELLFMVPQAQTNARRRQWADLIRSENLQRILGVSPSLKQKGLELQAKVA